MVKTHFLLESLSISEVSLGVMEKIQCSSVLSKIKYNYVALIFKQCIWYLLMLLNFKILIRIFGSVSNVRNFGCSSRVLKLGVNKFQIKSERNWPGVGAASDVQKNIPFYVPVLDFWWFLPWILDHSLLGFLAYALWMRRGINFNLNHVHSV